MNEHAGVGSLLSVLIIVIFTVIFHEADRVDPRNPKTASTAPDPAGRLRAREDPPSPPAPRPARVDPQPVTIAKARPTPATDPAVALVSVRPQPRPSTPPVARASVASLEVGASNDRRASSSPSPRPSVASPSRSAITIIEKGERLVDVAIRVYGSAEATVKLWRANRDRLSSVEAPVTEGWLLRTP